MKTSVYKYKIFIVISIILMQVFTYGCGGSGGGNHSEISDSVYTISGRVLQPETNANVKTEVVSDQLTTECNTTSLSEARNDDHIRKLSSLDQITVRLAQQPAIYAICDEEGYFKLNVPKIYQSVNLIAFKGNLNTSSFYIQKSNDIVLSEETAINAGKMQLSQGKNTFSIKIKDKYNNPVKYAKCTFWGFDITSDIDGILTFPLFPENIKKVSATISAAGFKEITNDYTVFTNDLGPVTELILRSNDDNKAPVILNFDTFDSEPNPNQQVDLNLSVTDPSKVLGNSYSVKWTCTDGKLLKTDERNTNIWQAPANIGLATVTATIYVEGYESSVSVGFAVGKSRTVNTKIDSFSPEKAAAGQTLTINGIGFGINKGEVYFVGGGAQVLSWSDTQIKVLVPDTAETGKITVKTGNKTLTSEEEFTAIDYNITLSVNYGVPGTEVSITGYGFGDTKAENSEILYYDEKIDNVVSWSNRLIKFKVEELTGAMPHTASLDLVIRGRKRSLGDFTVTYIKSISPEEAKHFTYESEIEKTLITITGAGFGDTYEDESGTAKSGVRFLSYGDNNTKEYIDAEINSWSDDEIEVYLPSKAQTGNIILKINDYEIQGPLFTVIPPSGYTEQVSARFSENIDVSKSLITGVIVKDNNLIYLCDPENNRLWYLENDEYNYILTTDATNIYKPYTGALTSDGDIILSDWENKTIVKLVDGTITKKSSYVFNGSPMGICISPSTGDIYCADSGADKIVIFDKNLVCIGSFGTSGVGNGQFSSPYGVCLNPTETAIFVADKGNFRVQQFSISSDSSGNKEYKFNCWYGSFNDSNGKHADVSEFGESSDKDLGFVSPTSVACDGTYLYVADSVRNDIQKIHLTNITSQVFGEEGNGTSQFIAPSDLKLFDTNMYIADSENHRMQIISKTGNYISQQKPEITGANVSFLGISLNQEKDSIYIVDTSDCSISKFDTYGAFEKKVGSKGNGAGQILNPSDVLLDKEDNIWVADTGNKRLVMFPADGSEAKSFGTGGSGTGQFKSPQRLACDSNGNIFVSDLENNIVLKFDKSGKYLYSIGQAELNGPMGIAIDSSDNLYVCDTGHYRICKYDANNQFEGWFGLAKDQGAGGWHDADEKSEGSSGSSPCQFIAPAYLDIDSSDFLYVVDYGNQRIQKLDTKNTSIIGGHICTIDVDAEVYGLALDDKDCFYITTNSFVRKYVPAP